MTGGHGQAAEPAGKNDTLRVEALQNEIAGIEAKRDEALEKLNVLREKVREQETEIVTKTTEVATLKSSIAKRAAEMGDTVGSGNGEAPGENLGKRNVPVGYLANITPYVVVIEGDKGTGTGFLCHADGQVWVYTAAHVMSGNSQIKVRDHKGNVYQEFEFLECAEDADIVRLKPKDQELKGLEIALPGKGPSVGEAVVAIGNSLGAGSLSGEPGKVISIEEDMWEVDTEIIPGNSGGPVLSLNESKVIGIVTHLIIRFRGESSLADKPETKRYAARLDKKREWRRMPVSRFVKEWSFIKKMHDESSIAWACARIMYAKSVPPSHREYGDSEAHELLKIAEGIVESKPKHFHVQAMDAWLKALKGVSEIGRNQHIDKGNAIVKRLLGDIRLSDTQPNSNDFSWFHRQSYQDEREWRLRLTMDDKDTD